MKQYTYPHTIDNGAGERITFLRRVPGLTGDRLEGQNVVEPGAGPPRRIHHYQEEEIPPIVQRVVFPILVAVGKLLGRYARYSDAPEPVRRD